MKINLTLILLVLLEIGCSEPDSNIIALTGATIYVGQGEVISRGTVLIQGDSILAIGNNQIKIPEGTEVIEFSGKYIMPGLVDAHVHYNQSGFFDSRPDMMDIREAINLDSWQQHYEINLNKYFETYLRSGITATYDVGAFKSLLKSVEANENSTYKPHISTTGPLLTPFPWEAISILATSTDTVLYSLQSAGQGRELVREIHSLGATGIKIWRISVSDSAFIKNLREVKQEIDELGNKMIVHAMTLSQAKVALKLGAKYLVHSVKDQLIDDEFIELAKQNDVIYCPTLIVSRGYLNAFKSLKDQFSFNDPNQVIDDRTKELLSKTRDYFKYFPDPENFESFLNSFETRVRKEENIMAENLVMVYNAGIKIVVGTDAGNPGTLHGISIYDELERFQDAGIPPQDIIKMATKNGAIAMERINDFGTLEKGKMADLIVLGNDPGSDIANIRTITHVMRKGVLRPVNQPF